MYTYLAAFSCPRLKPIDRGWWQMGLKYKKVENINAQVLHLTHYVKTVCIHVHVF